MLNSYFKSNLETIVIKDRVYLLIDSIDGLDISKAIKYNKSIYNSLYLNILPTYNIYIAKIILLLGLILLKVEE